MTCVHTSAGHIKDPGSSEAWFDAEEHLGTESLGCNEDDHTKQPVSEDSTEGVVTNPSGGKSFNGLMSV